jgi:hypothetical protein
MPLNAIVSTLATRIVVIHSTVVALPIVFKPPCMIKRGKLIDAQESVGAGKLTGTESGAWSWEMKKSSMPRVQSRLKKLTNFAIRNRLFVQSVETVLSREPQSKRCVDLIALLR